MIYGYPRVSNKSQKIDRQIKNILSVYPKAVLFPEAYTGTKTDRPQWNKLYKRLVKGDTVVFDSVSRMSRNSEDGFKLYEDLFYKGVDLIFLKEPHINTETYKQALETKIQIAIDTGDKATDKLMGSIISALNEFTMELAKKQILIAFEQAQKEVDDLHQRTKEGMAVARMSGKQIGRPSGGKNVVKKEKAAKEVILKHSKAFGGALNDLECRKLAGVSKDTYYKYKKELKENGI